MDSWSEGINRELINNAMMNRSEEKLPYIDDVGKNKRPMSLKGTVSGKTAKQALDAVAKTWYTYGAMTLKYTFADETTQEWTCLVASLNYNQRAGPVDVWEYTLTLAVGQERLS